MYSRTEAIVLRNQNYSEADLLVTFLTRDFGILTCFAKSPRKPGSRFGSSLEPLTHSRIAFIGKEQTALPRLVQSDIINSFHSLRQSYTMMSRLSACIRLTLRVIPERTPASEVFELFLHLLKSLHLRPDNDLAITFYLVRLVSIAGFCPFIDRCARCGAEAERFYISEGSTLCEECVDPSREHIEVPLAVKRLYRFLLDITPEVLHRLKPSRYIKNRLEEVLLSHINYTVDSRLDVYTAGLKK